MCDELHPSVSPEKTTPCTFQSLPLVAPIHNFSVYEIAQAVLAAISPVGVSLIWWGFAHLEISQ